MVQNLLLVFSHTEVFKMYWSRTFINIFQFSEDKASSYVDASNFRRGRNEETSTTEAPPTSPAVLLEPPIASPFAFHPPSGLSQEFDKAYFSTLDAFVHDF